MLHKNYFTYRMVDAWNSLPTQIVNVTTIASFGHRLDKHWEGQDIKFNFEATSNVIRTMINEDPDTEA